MDWRKAILALIVLSLFAMAAGLVKPSLPPANQSMHNVEVSEGRNQTPGGAGIPGGTNPYFPTTFPLPSPTARR